MTELAASLLNRLHDLVGSTTQTLLTGSPLGAGGGSGYQQQGLLSLGNGQSLAVPLTVQSPQDRKTIEKCYRSMEAVMRLCQQPRLNLKNSPPFILDILPDIFGLLQQIFTTNGTALEENFYLRLFLSNLLIKCKQTVLLFKESKEKIFESTTRARRSLSMKSLILSHMLFELKAEFPYDGLFIGSRYRITKRQAAEFWHSSFSDRTIVSWEEFRTEFIKVHKIGIGLETHALKNTIDLTANDHISNFEFDVFTRLFHPWDTLLKNWQILAVTHPAYVAFMTYDDVKTRLNQFIANPGSYVFRLSCTRLGQWAIGYVAPDRKIYQTIPQNKSLIQALVDGSREGFYLYPNGRSTNPDLRQLLTLSTTAVASESRVKVTHDQWAIYCEMGTTFEMCKICDERNKNVKLEPCGHLLCKICLTQWQESPDGDKTCPFCRCEIKGTEQVTIDLQDPGNSTGGSSGAVVVALSPRPAPALPATSSSSRVRGEGSSASEIGSGGQKSSEKAAELVAGPPPPPPVKLLPPPPTKRLIVDLPQQKRGVVQQSQQTAVAEKTPPLGQTPPSEAAPPPIPPRQSLLSGATGGNKAGVVENVTKKEPPSAGFQTTFGCFATSNGAEDEKGGGQERGGSRHGKEVLDLSGASRELSQFMLLVGENAGETEKGSETVAKPPKMPHPPSSSCDEGVTTRKGSGGGPKKKHTGGGTEGGTTSIISGERELFDDFMCMDFSSRQQPTQKGQTKE